MKLKEIGLLIVFVGLLLAGCGGAEGMVVTNVHGPKPPPTAPNAAIYLEVINQTDEADTLLTAKAEGCTSTEIHETVMKDDGTMSMQHLPAGVVIEAGETAVFEKGGLHIMCIGKTDEYGADGKVALLLAFALAGDIQVEAEIE